MASPPLTIGTVFPECILYCPMEWPLRFLTGFTAKTTAAEVSYLLETLQGLQLKKRQKGGLHFTLICFPIYLHFIRLHDLLNGLADVAQAHIYSCKLGQSLHSVNNTAVWEEKKSKKTKTSATIFMLKHYVSRALDWDQSWLFCVDTFLSVIAYVNLHPIAIGLVHSILVGNDCE